jgi:hypothetical protein
MEAQESNRGLPADVPKTDRELLLQINGSLGRVIERLEGKDGTGGLCAIVDMQGKRIGALENWRWYLLGGISLATFVLVVFGRYIDLGGKI